MPIYLYQCGKCNHLGEYLTGMGETPSNCDVCNSTDLNRVYENQTFAFKVVDPSNEPSELESITHVAILQVKPIGVVEIPKKQVDSMMRTANYMNN